MKKTNLIIIFVLCFAFTLLFSYPVVRYYIGMQQRFYQQRFVDVNYDRVISMLKAVFSISIPSDANAILAAETEPIDSSINFILRFDLPVKSGSAWLNSLEPNIYFYEDYTVAADERKVHLYPPPNWFLYPIRKGKVGIIDGTSGEMHIYVDTADSTIYVVYLKGFYAEQNRVQKDQIK